VDAAISALVIGVMTPAAIELTLEVRNEILARQGEADQLRSRALERAQIESDLAQRRFMLVDPGNRLVADTLEADWNAKLRILAAARDERDRARSEDQRFMDETIKARLMTVTADFHRLWSDPRTPNRERKRMLAYVIEDATLIKLTKERTTTVHVRFKGGRTETITTVNPKSAAEKTKTPPNIVRLIDKLLDDHTYPEIADILNAQRMQPGGSARRGRGDARFTSKRVGYIAHEYGLRSRYERLRERGMLTRTEAATLLGIHEITLVSWAKHGIVKRHPFNAHANLYEVPGPNKPVKPGWTPKLLHSWTPQNAPPRSVA
jgi:hypothetical protein